MEEEWWEEEGGERPESIEIVAAAEGVFVQGGGF